MKKTLLMSAVILTISTAAFAGAAAEKAGETVGKAVKETKEAGIVLIDGVKEGAKKTGEYAKELYQDTKEDIKDFKEGVKDGYKGEKQD